MKSVYLVFGLFVFLTSAWGQQSSNVELLSNFNPYPSIGYNDCWGYTDSQGREYALLGTNHGTSIIEISDPENPVERDFIPGPASRWRDIKTHSNYAYVVSEGAGDDGGLQIIDLRNLPDSAFLGNTISEWFVSAHNLYIDNGYAYVVGTHDGGGMHILNLVRPGAPERVSYYEESGYVHDVYVWNDTAYASAADSYDLVDLTDKSNPRLISSSDTIGGIYAHSGWLTEDKRYFIACEEGNTRDIMVYDLIDRSEWNLVVPSFQSAGNTPVHNVFVKGNYAHVSYYSDGYVVLDITDPVNPSIAGYYDTPSENEGFTGVWGVYPFFPSGRVIASDMNTGLYVFEFNGDETTVAEEIEPARNFILMQNYPNPFNPSTIIEYSIAGQSKVVIKIFDALGREIETLQNELKPAGTYKIKWNADNMPAGIYFYRIMAGEFIETRKMILMK
jgi:choice-of-anchor B domain-containing protein